MRMGEGEWEFILIGGAIEWDRRTEGGSGLKSDSDHVIESGE